MASSGAVCGDPVELRVIAGRRADLGVWGLDAERCDRRPENEETGAMLNRRSQIDALHQRPRKRGARFSVNAFTAST